MGETNVRVKLVIDSHTQRVVYGEADKSFIDFLFDLLSLPLGAVIRVLKKEAIAMVGCLGNLYNSIETFNEAYLLSNRTKHTVLKPKVSFNCSISTKLLPYASADPDPDPCTTTTTTTTPTTTPPATPLSNDSHFYTTTPLFGGPSAPSTATSAFPNYNTTPFGSCSAASKSPFGDIPRSNNTSIFIPQLPFGGRSDTLNFTWGEKVGFVKGLATYIVMDDLTVQPISEFSILTLLKEFNITDVDSLEEKLITLDVAEGVEILKASLQSNTVLTDVFLRRRRQIINDNFE